MPSQGFVQVHVYTSDANLPIANAAVSFSRLRSDGRNELIALRITDSSGNTGRIPVETPLVGASLDPQHPGGFSLITIAADAAAFERVRIEDVQIFPGIVTQQEIRLTPYNALPENRGETEKILITPQPL